MNDYVASFNLTPVVVNGNVSKITNTINEVKAYNGPAAPGYVTLEIGKTKGVLIKDPGISPQANNGLTLAEVTDLGSDGGTALLNIQKTQALPKTSISPASLGEASETAVINYNATQLAALPKGVLYKIESKELGYAIVYESAVANAFSPYVVTATKAFGQAVLNQIKKDRDLAKCTVCKANNNTDVCTQAEALFAKAGQKTDIETICTKLIGKPTDLIEIYTYLNKASVSVAAAKAFIDDAKPATTDASDIASLSNLVALDNAKMDNWLYLYSNHSTKANFTRKDINALTKWNYINTDTKNSIINFSDNTP